MVTEKSGKLEELAKLATDFVTMQKGMWDHAAWTDFVSSLKTKGYDLSEEMQANLGELLEAMKRFYAAAGSTESLEKAMRNVMSDSVAFIQGHKGVWGHAEWEEFVGTMHRNTLSLTEGASAYLGGVLESIKVFYSSAAPQIKRTEPSGSIKSEAASKPAAATKRTAEPKPAKPKTEAKPAQPKPAEPKVAAKPAAKVPDKKDDLTAIAGIGPALAKKLNAAGISGFAQLAALSDDDIARLEKNIIKFTGRIKRDDWIGQAKMKLSQK